MKLILTTFVVLAILGGVLAAASAQGVLDLSTLNKKHQQAMQPIILPQLTPMMPTTPATALGGQSATNAIDLSTLGKKYNTSMATTIIKGPNPITVTPMFSVMNMNMTGQANTVFTLPQAVAANPQVYTPPIAIFGGA
jgi:hypothetical protein